MPCACELTAAPRHVAPQWLPTQTVLFGWSHFSLLATVQGEGPASPPLLPLSTRDAPLQLRFLTEAEEREQGGAQQLLGLLQRYMDAEALFNGSLGVRLSGRPLGRGVGTWHRPRT